MDLLFLMKREYYRNVKIYIILFNKMDLIKQIIQEHKKEDHNI